MAHEQDPLTPATSDPAVPPPPYPEGTSSEQIRRDIRQTRAEMNQTVDTLGERLRPRHLIDDLLDMFRSSGGGEALSGAKESFRDAGYKVVDKLKQHPMPAALIGAGLVWLLFEDDGRGRLRSYEPRKWEVPERSGSYVDARTGQPYEESGEASRQSATLQTGAAEKLAQGARAVGEKVGEWTEAARDTASSAAHEARDYTSAASEQISRGYERSKHAIERGMDEYPLAIGAAAMALGVLTGLCLPRTRTEDRLMGEAADQVKDRAKEAGREAVERGKEVARTAGDEAERQGLSPDAIGQKVKRVADETRDAAAESAKRQGIDPQTLAHKGQQVAERTKDSAREQAPKSEPQKQRDFPA